jgi:EAL domain-containing protein (putative c-di-GMP-specific phosphodiesterase class I)/GGDEF domain-containing protein
MIKDTALPEDHFSDSNGEDIDCFSSLRKSLDNHSSLNLLSRQQFLKQLESACALQQLCSDQSFALLQLKLDRFKILRCSLGDEFAQQLLILISARLQHCLTTSRVAAYLREDEFAILLEHTHNIDEAQQLAKLLHESMRSPFTIAGLEIFLNIHIGITTSRISEPQPIAVLNDVDLATFTAQQCGGTYGTVFDPTIRAQTTQRLQLENDIRLGLLRGEFLLNYQPLFTLENNQLIGFEALVRWHHSEHGLISPATFIPVAEETGSIIELGWWVLREACLQMKKWQQQFPIYQHLAINVNLSSQQFSLPDFIEKLDTILRETGLEGQYLKLEITETVLMKNVDSAAARLEQLQARGIRLCIDDFGTGYSSLSYLQRFPVSTLKIDRSFIAQMEVDSKSAGILQSIILLASYLGMDVVAEGIETAEQFWQLKALQCEYGQGYFFARPLNLDNVQKLLQGLHRRVPH